MSRSQGSPGGGLCVVTGSYHPMVGGGETQMRSLAAGLAARGVRCMVLTQRRPVSAPAVGMVDAAEVYRVWPRGCDRWGKYLMTGPALVKLLVLRRQYAVILVSGVRTLGVVGVLAARLLGKRCVLRVASCSEFSGDYIWARGGRLRRAVARPVVGLRNAVLRRADAFVAISSAVREEYRACGVPEERVVSIPNGTDVQRFEPADAALRARRRQDLGLPADGRLVVYTGKLNRGKGLEQLVAVWPALRVSHPGAQLVLVGGGGGQAIGCEAELRRQVAALGLDDAVRLTGYVEDVVAWLQAADLFVLPSDSEAMPNALIEAMACGLPCVASWVGGVRDIVEDGRNGLAVPAGDGEALLAALRRVLDDPEQAAAMGRAARSDAVRRYSREANAAQVHALLQRLAGSAGVVGG